MKSAAKEGDRVVAMDTHFVHQPPTMAAVAVQMPFSGPITAKVSSNVLIQARRAAVIGSVAENSPKHLPAPAFVKEPSNVGTVVSGSATVLINGIPAARHDDMAKTCNDPVDVPVGRVVASNTVLIGK